MNIIKFKDTVITDTNKRDFEWYNENLRGKYAFWVRCRYVVSLNDITQNMYVSFETTINNLLECDYYILSLVNDEYKYSLIPINDVSENQTKRAVLVTEIPSNPSSDSPALIKIDHHKIKYVDLWDGDYYWMNSYIDYVETDNINNIDGLKQSNNYIPTGDLSLDEIKRFRTWLASSLLDLNYSFYEWDNDNNEYKEILTPTLSQRLLAELVEEIPNIQASQYIKIKNLNVVDWDDNQTHILNYYKNGMYDETLKWVSLYGGINTSVIDNSTVNINACGCGTNTNISSLYNSSIGVCDVPFIYKKSIKQGMITLFSNINTWIQLPHYYLLTIKSYIDGIIQSNLKLVFDGSNNEYYDCKCLNKGNQDNGISILRQLSSAFEYLSSSDTLSTHKNFILTTLNKWASELYEIMEWN